MSDGQSTRDDVLRRMRQFIEETFLYVRRDIELRDTDSLLGRGIVDSMGVIEVLEFLNAEFGVAVEDDEITEENLGNLEAISAFVVQKQGQESAA